MAETDERALIDDHDRRFVESIEDAERKVVVTCSLVRHRQPDRLGVGDRVPALELQRLEGEGSVALAALGERPTVLIFGSYT